MGTYEVLSRSENFDSYSIPKNTVTAPPSAAAPLPLQPELIPALDSCTEESLASRTNLGEGQMIEVEKRESGRVKWAVYKSYFLAYGGLLLASMILITYALRQASSFGEKRYIAHWSDRV